MFSGIFDIFDIFSITFQCKFHWKYSIKSINVLNTPMEFYLVYGVSE